MVTALTVFSGFFQTNEVQELPPQSKGCEEGALFSSWEESKTWRQEMLRGGAEAGLVTMEATYA